MAKFILTDWEINGYDDSDFMLTYWDDVEKKVEAHCYASTRYGGCYCKLPEGVQGASGYHLCGNALRSDRQEPEMLLWPTPEAVEAARAWLEEYILVRLTQQEKRRVDEPSVEELSVGLHVRLTADCRYQINTTEPCNKCSGSGKWTNPKNPADKRDCFGCKGTGQHVTGKAKDASGKLRYEKLTAGTHGLVVDWRSFGQFYARGYNQPDRHNTTVQFCVDGRTVRASLEKLRLHRDYESPDSLRARAKSLSANLEFSGIYPKHAWDTHNFARQAVAFRQST